MDSPNDFKPWHVREWSRSNNSNLMTFGTEGHTRRAGMSRKQVLTKIGVKMDAHALRVIPRDMKEKYEHALKRLPSKKEVDRKCSQRN